MKGEEKKEGGRGEEGEGEEGEGREREEREESKCALDTRHSSYHLKCPWSFFFFVQFLGHSRAHKYSFFVLPFATLFHEELCLHGLRAEWDTIQLIIFLQLREPRVVSVIVGKSRGKGSKLDHG
jgi:hypothetical protein